MNKFMGYLDKVGAKVGKMAAVLLFKMILNNSPVQGPPEVPTPQLLPCTIPFSFEMCQKQSSASSGSSLNLLVPPSAHQGDQANSSCTPYVKDAKGKVPEGVHFWLREEGLVICDASGRNKLMAASKMNQNSQARVHWK